MSFYNQDIRASEQAPSTFPDNPISISSYQVNPIGQYASRAHVDAACGFTQPEGTPLFSDDPQVLSPLLPVVDPPSTIPTTAQASSRTARPSNAFMIFRSEYVKRNDLVGRRQQELSIMAACAWRALGPDGQTGWYEKAALARGQYDTKNLELKAPRQRPKPYRPRVNARDVVQTDTMRPVRETYAAIGPSLSARRRMRKSVDQPLVSPSTPIEDPLPIARSSTLPSSSTFLHPSPFFAGYLHHRQEEANISPTTSIESDKSYEGPNVHLWASTIELARFDYVVSAPNPTAASAAPLSPCDSFSPQDVSGFPSPTQYPSPVSPSDWANRFPEPQYNFPDTMSTTGASYNPVGLYDEHSSPQGHFQRHGHFF